MTKGMLFYAILEMFKGRWEVTCDPNNQDTAHFWKSVINEYTDGNYTLIEACPDLIYKDGETGETRYGNLFVFEN